jgi:hypothetical protein
MSKEYYQKNKTKILEAQKVYYQNNKEQRKKVVLEYYNKNKKKIKAYRAKWHQENKFSKRVREIKRKYGLSYDEYEWFYKRQDKRCAICYSKLKEGFDVDKCIDHNHKTGKIRGLLCTKCNFIIGLANEDTSVLLKAVNYLQLDI